MRWLLIVLMLSACGPLTLGELRQRQPFLETTIARAHEALAACIARDFDEGGWNARLRNDRAAKWSSVTLVNIDGFTGITSPIIDLEIQERDGGASGVTGRGLWPRESQFSKEAIAAVERCRSPSGPGT